MELIKKMKILINSLIVFLLISNLSIAQNNTTIGLKAGVSFSDWYGKDAVEFADILENIMSENSPTRFNFDKTYRFGFLFGAFINFNINDIFSLQPEFYYCMKGVKFDGGGDFDGYNIDTRLILKTNYIEFPLLVKLSTKKNNTTKLFLIFGPSIAFNSSSDLKVVIRIDGESGSDETDFDFIKDTDFCFILGGGLSLPNGIIFDARYNLGMVSVNDTDEQLKIKNRIITLMLGFHF